MQRTQPAGSWRAQPATDLACHALDCVTLCTITRRLKEVAPRWNEPVTYIWCHAPRHECRRRVQANTTDSWQRKNARLDFVDSADEQYFWPVHGESEHEVFPPQPRLMMGTAQVMRGTFLPRC